MTDRALADENEMLQCLIAGLIAGWLLIFGGPLAAAFLAKTFGPGFALFGIVVPIVVAVLLLIGPRRK